MLYIGIKYICLFLKFLYVSVSCAHVQGWAGHTDGRYVNYISEIRDSWF